MSTWGVTTARTLSSLGFKQLAHRKGRSALTALGIVLGVAILFGVLVSNATTKAGVDALVRDFTGRANVIAGATGAFDATFPASTLQRVARLPGVTDAVGIYSFRSAIIDPKGERVEISLRGIDLSSARTIQDYPLERGAFFEPGARSVVAPERLLRKVGKRVGQTIDVATPYGTQTLPIGGQLANTGAGRTNQGDVVFTSIKAARELVRAGDVLSSVRIVLAEGADADAWIADHRDDVGSGVDLQNASTLAEGFQDILGILGAIFAFFAALVLFVGAFLIYLTLSMAVIERTRVYGTMRALGATRAQVRRVVVTEALSLGTLSTLGGLLTGLLIAKGLIAMLSSLFELDIPGIVVPSWTVVAGLVVGVVTTLASSLIPARRASRLDPVEAIKGDYARESRLSRAWLVGAACAAAGTALSSRGNGGALGTPVLLLGAVLLVPPLLRPLARALGWYTHRLARGVGDVAVLHLSKERSRSAYTLALIMVVMAMIFSTGGLYASMAKALDATLDRQFGADIQIDAPGTLPAAFEDELRAIRGVGPITALRLADVDVVTKGTEREHYFVRIIDPDTYFAIGDFQWVQGDEAVAARALAAGGAILFPEADARTLHKRAGDSIRVITARGPRDFRIAATYASLEGPARFVAGVVDGRRYFNATGADRFHLNVAGESVDFVRSQIERTLAGRYALEVGTAGSEKAAARKQFGQFFNIFYAIILVAAIVGLLGLANTLAMSVLQRSREIGVLRAIGTTRGQVRRMVLAESATLGLVAFVLSVPLGLLLSLATVRAVSRAFAFDVAYVYPSAWVPLVAAFGIVVAVLAALGPSRRAARLDVVTALQFE